MKKVQEPIELTPQEERRMLNRERRATIKERDLDRRNKRSTKRRQWE